MPSKTSGPAVSVSVLAVPVLTVPMMPVLTTPRASLGMCPRRNFTPHLPPCMKTWMHFYFSSSGLIAPNVCLAGVGPVS
jgi:hypothetical protein